MPIRRPAIIVGIVVVIAILAISLYVFRFSRKETKFTPSQPYASTSADVVRGKEAILTLEDGALLIIPAHALSGDAHIVFERNPSKSASFPSLESGDTALSEFYSFQVEGADLLLSAELVIPTNIAGIPDEQADGNTFAMIPTEEGWEYSPVALQGDKAVYVTDQPGDPLIAWHFAPCPPDNKYSDLDDIACFDYKKKLEKRAICAPRIPVSMIPLESGDGFEIVGQLQTANIKYFGFIPRTPAANQPVTLYINKTRPYTASMHKYSVTTDEEGSFHITVKITDPDSDLQYGPNWIRVAANCDPWPGEVSVLSQGEYRSILNEPATAAQPEAEPTQEAPTEAPVSSNNPLLVQVPNVVGLNKHQAGNLLASAGIFSTHGAGSSPYEVGVIYKQDPPAGTMIDPYQTVVLTYVTTEQSSPASSMQSFTFAHYDCMTYIRYGDDDGVRREGCLGKSVEYQNAGGKLTVVSRDDYGERTYPVRASITNPMPDHPFWESFMHSSHYWWLPSTSQSYTTPANTSVMDDGHYTSGKSEITFQPTGTTTITLAGRTFDAVIYTAEYDWISNNDNINNDGSFIHRTDHIRITDYFDAESGMLLQSEYHNFHTACETNDASVWTACANGSYAGTEDVEIFQLTATDLP